MLGYRPRHHAAKMDSIMRRISSRSTRYVAISPVASLLKTTNPNFPQAAIQYLQDQWLPRGAQFLKCFRKDYRNFGISASQGSEAQHFSCKVFFDNNLADLHTLLSRLQEMVKQKALEWQQECAKEAAICRHSDRNCPIRKELATRITFRALDLIREQFVMASSARLGTHNLGQCTGAFTTQYGLPCKHIIYGLLRVEMSATGAPKIVATRPLQLKEVCKYWRLPQRLEDMDPLLGEEDPRVVACRGRPRNAPEDGIVTASGTVIRRARGRTSWQREPSSHEYLETATHSSDQRASQCEGRVARQLATEGFVLVNSQQGGEEERPPVRGNGHGGRRGHGRGRGEAGLQPYERVLNFSK